MSESFQIVEYNTTAAALAELRARHGGTFDVSTSKGMAAAKEARAEVKGYRVALEKLRVELKAPALERTRLIDAEAKRITAELEAQQRRIDEEKRKLEAANIKVKNEKAKTPVDPLADLKRKLAAGKIPATVALDQAYQIGFTNGLESAKQAA